MTPIILEVWNGIANLIADDYSAGYSGLDISDRVFKGRFQDKPLTNAVYVSFIDQSEENGNALTRYKGILRFQIYAFASGHNNFDRVSNAIQLGADVQNKILANRTLNLTAGRIDNIVLEITALDGDRFGFNSIGISVLEMQVYFQSDRGI